MGENLRDRLVNFYLHLKSIIRNKLRVKKFGNNEPDLSKFILDFSDDFKSFNGDNWRLSQPWGNFHPEYPFQYYGEDSVYFTIDGLILNQKYSPKSGLKHYSSDKEFDIPYSIGLVSSKNFFGYGFYEFLITLPNGIGLWPAVWLTDSVTWPPEIDIIEAYSDQNSKYGDRLQTNFHFDFDENKKSSGARNHPIYSHFDKIKVSCWWDKNFIKIYYNGYLVREITCENTLKFFRDRKMMVVLNNAVRKEYIHYIDNSKVTELKIHSFRYYKLG
jgi:beta-glucanase (GH16 family)